MMKLVGERMYRELLLKGIYEAPPGEQFILLPLLEDGTGMDSPEAWGPPMYHGSALVEFEESWTPTSHRYTVRPLP